MAAPPRPYHVVVWGSTGVVGRLVAEHLTRDAQKLQKEGVKWALAGRNQKKLDAVRKELESIDASAKDVPIITADLADPASLEHLAKQAKVVLATVGPYAISGTPMVKACVDSGTHYCDITGETPWARKMIREFDASAKKNGVRIIHFAGFDSIPSDLGTYLVTDHIKKTYNKDTKRVECLWSYMDGQLSGGTVASLFGALLDDQGEDSKAVSDPYGLDPPDSIRGPDKNDSLLPGYSKLHKKFYFPFVMAPVNTRCVRRSNALLGHRYGKDFAFVEAFQAPNRFAAYLGSFVMTVAAGMFSLSFLRSFWLRILPQAGQMPNKEKIYKGSWTNTIIGVPEGDESKLVKAEVKSVAGDPGYWSTSRMLLEAGLTIALQEEELKASNNIQSGVLTPAAALGHVLLKRLNARKEMLSFRIVDP